MALSEQSWAAREYVLEVAEFRKCLEKIPQQKEWSPKLHSRLMEAVYMAADREFYRATQEFEDMIAKYDTKKR